MNGPPTATLRCGVAWIAALAVGVAGSTTARAVTFTNVTAAAGINHTQTLPALIQGLPSEAFFSGGVAAGDFDGDGHVDLVFTRLNDNDILYRNRGDGTFEARTSTAGFRFPTYTNGVVSGDVDNDGDLDLYMTTVGYTRNYLYLNDGTGHFTDAGTSHPTALASSTTRSGQGASFGDYDGDGYLDLVTGDWGNTVANSQSRLFRNLGATQPGGFQDVTVAAGINVYRGERTYRFAPRFVDLDRDGHADLTFAADFHTSQLFWNNGNGTFTDGTLAAGVGTDFNGMGSTFGDYDGDGDLDWFITNITNDPLYPGPFGGFNRLYRNDGGRQFTDVTLAAGVRDSRWSWGTTFFDYDNDGDADLSATNGYNGPGWANDQTYLWENTGGVFQHVSTASGITDTQQGRGLVHLDYDSDGDLDLLVVNHAATPILYRNDGGNANHYLRIETQGVESNRDGIGTWITVTPDLSAPHQQMVWEIDGGSSFVSQSERTAHFGLGQSADPVDLITIQWPSGIVQRLYDVAIDQTLPVIETAVALPGDYNDDGVVDVADYTVWRDHQGAPAGALRNDALNEPIGPAHYAQWAENYLAASSAAFSSPAAVPEPAAAVLLLLAASGHQPRRRG
ncbi:CRTAC1 family protein [Botrimarina hoheduenensis]|uniref:ASPIC and UnbV n=1 Tax=Botrimarina hoheduenensis TaxID=2528000 RepID=A0A5C5W849_9BACT|nr:CRTAC1 family protein [Botrimarina hoheduenensis]TWT46890.1 ASPIC and UnbV [Botrimarina hoheduenensis]